MRKNNGGFEMRDIGKISNTKAILEKFDLTAKKAFGQNFLVDLNIIDNIASSTVIDKETCVIEIGPGIGGLTEFLARKAKKVIAYDIDERLMEVLEYSLSEYNNVEVILQDFLTVDLEQLCQKLSDFKRVVIVSNLPYYITSELLSKIVVTNTNINSFIGMMQKEVAIKLNSNENSPLKVMIDLVGTINYEFTVSSQVFIPKPHVDSAVISIEFDKIIKFNKKIMNELLGTCFKQRRKTIYNNLTSINKDKDRITTILAKANIDPKARAEQLTTTMWLNLYDAYNN